MSAGLYSMQSKDFDKTLDLTKIKPYGDTMNDGKVQLSFTLPVPCGAEAVEAAKQFIKGMGMENPQVVFYQELTPGFTFFNCYGNAWNYKLPYIKPSSHRSECRNHTVR